MSVVLTSQVQEMCRDLFPGRENLSLIILITHELRRRLAEYQMMNQYFCRKYNLDFPSFQEKMKRQPDYSFEVESDFCDWEMAIDGIESMKKKIASLESCEFS